MHRLQEHVWHRADQAKVHEETGATATAVEVAKRQHEIAWDASLTHFPGTGGELKTESQSDGMIQHAESNAVAARL